MCLFIGAVGGVSLICVRDTTQIPPARILRGSTAAPQKLGGRCARLTRSDRRSVPAGTGIGGLEEQRGAP